MTTARAEPPAWPLRKWVISLGCITMLQLGLIAWASRKTSGPTPNVPTSSQMHLRSDGRGEMPVLLDPTLFVLPGRQGFSGPSWLQAPAMEYHAQDEADAPRLLTNNVTRLGAALEEEVTKLSRPLTVATKSEPRLDAVDYYVPSDLIPTQSMLRIEGGLANRSLVRPLLLESQPAANILSNSVVEVVVDAVGRVFSPPALLQGCGLDQADARAIELAASARFKPLSRSAANQGGGLTWGRLVFQWRTIPLPPTNSPDNK